jgi:hypothetical protein
MPFLELFDETLDINSTENYELSIQVSPDGLSYCLLDTVRNKFVMVRSWSPEENKYYNAATISEMIYKDDFLTKKFKRVSCVMPSQKFTLVPAPLYDPGKKVQYFSFNHNQGMDSAILANKIADPDAFLVFSTVKSIADVINGFYPGVNIYHHIKLLLDQTSVSRKVVSGNFICLHVERDFFNLIVFKDNILRFCNSFTYRNISDILYFVLNTFKNLEIKQEETVYFSGLTERYDDLSSSLSLYVRNIKFAEPSGNFTFSYVFNDIELHRFINLFTLVNCES